MFTTHSSTITIKIFNGGKINIDASNSIEFTRRAYNLVCKFIQDNEKSIIYSETDIDAYYSSEDEL